MVRPISKRKKRIAADIKTKVEHILETNQIKLDSPEARDIFKLVPGPRIVLEASCSGKFSEDCSLWSRKTWCEPTYVE